MSKYSKVIDGYVLPTKPNNKFTDSRGVVYATDENGVVHRTGERVVASDIPKRPPETPWHVQKKIKRAEEQKSAIVRI